MVETRVVAVEEVKSDQVGNRISETAWVFLGNEN
jgi:hypothetical protein